MIQLSNELIYDLNEKNLVIILLEKTFAKKEKTESYFGMISKKKKRKLLVEINYLHWKDFQENESLVQIIDIKHTFRFMELSKEISVLNSMRNIDPNLLLLSAAFQGMKCSPRPVWKVFCPA